MKQGLSAIRRRTANWLWMAFLHIRIALRVQWLLFKRWWGESVSLGGLLSALRRPIVLFLVGLALPIFGFLLHWQFTNGNWMTLEEFKHLVTIEGPVGSRFLIQPILLLIGVPSAFVLWAFRDHNAKAALENQRKDINLKEFQEIQLRAAGALDEKLPAKARQTLQVAAIHQLRPFLRGEYGDSFRRPAWELLKARLATSAEECGYVAITDWVERGGFPSIEGESVELRISRNLAEIGNKIAAIKPDAVAIAAQTLVMEDAKRLFRRDLPLERGRYDGANLRNVLLARIRIASASFVGADLSRAHMEGAKLSFAHLEQADLSYAHMEGAILFYAHLESAYLLSAHMEGANLLSAHMEGAKLGLAQLTRANLSQARLKNADLSYANLQGASLFRAHLEGADLSYANLASAMLNEAHLDDKTNLDKVVYDDDTCFVYLLGGATEAQREAARKPWRDRGMIHVSEVEPG